MPARDYTFYVYILASRSLTLYIGLTNNLRARVFQHREKRAGTFTARYNIDRLVYFEQFTYVNNAIAREKELKDWNRAKKITLIKSANPTWQDLAANL
jgi:putative endonuclease